jgi:hypothetical protein
VDDLPAGETVVDLSDGDGDADLRFRAESVALLKKRGKKGLKIGL